jgi:hypothetical protein
MKPKFFVPLPGEDDDTPDLLPEDENIDIVDGDDEDADG